MDCQLDRALLLLDHDIDLNIRDNYNDTAFFIAWRKHVQTKEDEIDEDSEDGTEHTVTFSTLIERMLDKGIDLCATNSSGRTPLMVMCGDDAFPDSRQLKSILERILTRIDESKRSLCLNTLDNEGDSVIMYAMARMRPAEIVLTLLELSADPFVGDQTRSNLFFRLIYDEPEDLDEPIVVPLPGAEDSKITVEAITKLVELGYDPKAVDETGGTAFHVLARHSKYRELEHKVKPLVALLTKWGVDICSTDELGRTPLMLACIRRKYWRPSELVDVFLDQVIESERTAYVNTMDCKGNSSLMYASYSYEPGVIVLRLLALSANPFVGKDPTGSKLFFDLLASGFQGSAGSYLPAKKTKTTLRSVTILDYVCGIPLLYEIKLILMRLSTDL